MTRARQVANFDPALFAADEVSGDKVSGGTIGAGTWEGTDVAVAHGGTGASTHTANGVLLGAGTSAITSAAPSSSGNVLTSNGTVWASAAAAGGITHASIWRQTSWLATSSTSFGDNWEEANTTNTTKRSPGVLGSSMTESSGIFTFPDEGIWSIQFVCFAATSAPTTWVVINMYVTEDDGATDYEVAAQSYGSEYANNAFENMSCNTLFDVIDKDDYKCKFSFDSLTSNDIAGDANNNKTYATFIRLGDT